MQGPFKKHQSVASSNEYEVEREPQPRGTFILSGAQAEHPNEAVPRSIVEQNPVASTGLTDRCLSLFFCLSVNKTDGRVGAIRLEMRFWGL
jgi:hypothetical protein